MRLGQTVALAALFAAPAIADDVIVTTPSPGAPAQELREASPLAPVPGPEELNAARHEQATHPDPKGHRAEEGGVTPNDRNSSVKPKIAH
jgi:hypothetical protein